MPHDARGAVEGAHVTRFAVTVYAGSRRTHPEGYASLARALGEAIARRGWVLVYGGAEIGLMGACADAALAAGGRVEGVILDTFARVVHRGVESMEIVGSMRDRKAGLAHRGDAFVVLPGGFGTLEELSEILVERQLAVHHKPLILLDAGGFWRPLLSQFEVMVEAGLLKREYVRVLDVVPDVPAALAILEDAAARRHPG
jgi:uncharacterized protein (TIGR00730 family)